jgi:hypothetical protein
MIDRPTKLKSPPPPNCASGTPHNTGEAIHNAVRERQHRELLSYPAKSRRKRPEALLRAMYDEAMREKRARALWDFAVANPDCLEKVTE